MAGGKFQSQIKGLCALCPSCQEHHFATGVRSAEDGTHQCFQLDDHKPEDSEQSCPGSGLAANEVVADAALCQYMSTLGRKQ